MNVDTEHEASDSTGAYQYMNEQLLIQPVTTLHESIEYLIEKVGHTPVQMIRQTILKLINETCIDECTLRSILEQSGINPEMVLHRNESTSVLVFNTTNLSNSELETVYKQIYDESMTIRTCWVQCDVCKGARFNRETLQVKYKNYSIPATIELKGILISHIKYDNAWSLEIKLKKGHTINGFKNFSICQAFEKSSMRSKNSKRRG